MAGFAPHGKCTVSWQGNLLTVSYEGVFNREGAEVLGQALEAPLARRAGRPWVMLNDARLWEGGTPEAFGQFLKDEIATHKKFNECGQDNTERFQGHLALFYGFVALFIVTSAVAIGHWGGYVLHWLEPLGHTPMPLYHPMKLLAQVGAVLLLYGLTMLTRRRLNADHAQTAFFTDDERMRRCAPSGWRTRIFRPSAARRFSATNCRLTAHQ